MKTIAFFGHRHIFAKPIIQQRLSRFLKLLIPQGFSNFLIGCHGDFDNLAFSSCLDYKKNVDNKININIVLTNLSFLNKNRYEKIDFYENIGCKTLFYDIENIHYKNRITYSNKKMVDESDLIICYVDVNAYKSGAKSAINYAIKQNKKIINLFEN